MSLTFDSESVRAYLAGKDKDKILLFQGVSSENG